MGWLFILLGVVLGAVGTFLVYYGQDLLRRPQPTAIEKRHIALSPPQERLLGLLASHQKEFAATKLVVGRRTGVLHFDGEPDKAKGTNLIAELFGPGQEEARAAEFERLMESLPSEVVRFYGETRLGSPFVVSVTSEGLQYLRR